MAQEHRRGRKAEYTDRPLTEEEKIFAEEHHDFLYIYMRNRHLLIEEWYDLLVIPYLQAVKSIVQDQSCKKHMYLNRLPTKYYRVHNIIIIEK